MTQKKRRDGGRWNEHRFKAYGRTPGDAIRAVLLLGGESCDSNVRMGQCVRVYVVANSAIVVADQRWSALLVFPCDPPEPPAGEGEGSSDGD